MISLSPILRCRSGWTAKQPSVLTMVTRYSRWLSAVLVECWQQTGGPEAVEDRLLVLRPARSQGRTSPEDAVRPLS